MDVFVSLLARGAGLRLSHPKCLLGRLSAVPLEILLLSLNFPQFDLSLSVLKKAPKLAGTDAAHFFNIARKHFSANRGIAWPAR